MDAYLSISFRVQAPLNLVNVLERALQALSRSQPHVKAAKQTAPGPATQSEAEGLLGSTLLLVLAVRLLHALQASHHGRECTAERGSMQRRAGVAARAVHDFSSRPVLLQSLYLEAISSSGRFQARRLPPPREGP